MFIDTHTHLYSEEFDQDREAMINRAFDAGVDQLYLPNIDKDSIAGMIDLSRQYPGKCIPMMGLHPCSVKDDYPEQLNLCKEWLQKEKFAAIGEIGIDLFWDKSFLIQQQDAFRQQIQWAKTMKLPIVIHARDSFNEIFEIVDELNDENLTGIFHCFTGNTEQANKVIAYGGFKIGIGGVVTFKNSGLDSVLKEVALEHIVLETDSPYLAPVPNRGKRNESAYITAVASKLSEIYRLPIAEIGKITSANARTVFNQTTF